MSSIVKAEKASRPARTFAVKLPSRWTVDDLLGAPVWRIASADMAAGDVVHVIAGNGAIEAELAVTAPGPGAQCELMRKADHQGGVVSMTVLDGMNVVKIERATWSIVHAKRDQVMSTGPSEAELVARWQREHA